MPAAPRLPPAGNVASDFRASLDDPDAEQRGVEAAMRAGSDAPGKALEGDDVAAARLSSMLGGCRLA